MKELLPILLITVIFSCEKPVDDIPGGETPDSLQNISANKSQILLDNFFRSDTIVIESEAEWTVNVLPYSDIKAEKLTSAPDKIVVSAPYEVTNGADLKATIIVSPVNSSDTAALYIPVTRLAVPKDTILFGGHDNDAFNAIVNAGVDELLAVGYSASADEGGQHHGSKDFWVVRLDRQGRKLWSRKYGGSQDDVATCVAASYGTENMTSYFDGYIVGGYTYSNDGDVTGHHGQKDAWLIKIDSLGNLVWQKTLGTAGDDDITSLLNGTEPGTLICGTRDGDQWLMKLNQDGDVKWEKTFGSSGIDLAGSVTETMAGYYFTGSGKFQDGDVADKPTSTYDAWVVKIGKDDGETDWVRYIGGSADEKGLLVAGFYNNEVMVIGTTESSDIFPEFDGQRNIFAAFYDVTGNLLWKKIIKHTKWDEPVALGGSKFGNLIIGGKSKNPSSNANGENAFDASLIVMSPTGDVILSRMLGGPGPDCITGITTAGFSKPVVGYSSGSAAISNLDGYFGWFDYR